MNDNPEEENSKAEETSKAEENSKTEESSSESVQPTPFKASQSGPMISVPAVLSPIDSSPVFNRSKSDLFTPLANIELVRRHSIGIPSGSIASEILNTRKSLLTDIRDLQEQLSDFGSCVSDIQTTDSSSEECAVDDK